MSLVLCPICEEVLEDNVETCTKCGFPIRDKDKLREASKILLCPKCGETYTKAEAFGLDNNHCKICNTEIIQLDMIRSEYTELVFGGKLEWPQSEIEFIKKYGNNQFSEEAFYHCIALHKQKNNDKTIQPSKPQVTCPYCNSTNTKKITTAKRAGSIIGLGILSKKIGKQWHCDNCGSDF